MTRSASRVSGGERGGPSRAGEQPLLEGLHGRLSGDAAGSGGAAGGGLQAPLPREAHSVPAVPSQVPPLPHFVAESQGP